MKPFGSVMSAIIGKEKNTDAITLSEKDLLEEIAKRLAKNEFPIDVFPRELDPWIRSQVVDMQLEPCFVGLSILQAVSVAIGPGIVAKMGMMREKAHLFSVLVGYTSSGKSVSMDMNMRPIEAKQMEFDKQNDEGPIDEGDKKEKPVWHDYEENAKAIYVKDATTDAFTQLLEANPRGILRYYDEFRSWFEDQERLKVNAGDITFWTEKWNSSASHRVKRKGKKSKIIPSVTLYCTLFGGTQPDLLKSFFTKGKYEQGFSWRFLYAIQPKYIVADISPFLEFPEVAFGPYRDMFANIFENFTVWEHGRQPEIVPIDHAGINYYVSWNNKAKADVDASPDTMVKNAKAGIHGKMKQYVVRLSLILKIMHECQRPGRANMLKIEDHYVRDACRLANYFLEANYLAYQIVFENLVVPPDVKRLATVLKRNYWNRSNTAEELNISRPTLNLWIAKYSRMYPSVFETNNKT
jgi:Protein of unknown function (DUF3987)/Bacterial regulatory protein, Fis family